MFARGSRTGAPPDIDPCAITLDKLESSFYFGVTEFDWRTEWGT